MMASVGFSNPAITHSFHRQPTPQNIILSPFSVNFPLCNLRLSAIKTGSEGGGAPIQETTSVDGSDFLRKPTVSSALTSDDTESVKEYSDADDDNDNDNDNEKNVGDGDTWVDWEDQILEDTVPLVGFVRMILHSGKYESGERLSPEHEKTIRERLLAHHPECEKKIGCGVDYITIGYHPNFDSSRCLFIVRKDGELVDFSYWKCIKGFIRKNYPLYADSFILRHFRKRRRY